jgi:hypothetical protein
MIVVVVAMVSAVDVVAGLVVMSVMVEVWRQWSFSWHCSVSMMIIVVLAGAVVMTMLV